MNKTCIGLLVAMALGSVPMAALAQEDSEETPAEGEVVETAPEGEGEAGIEDAGGEDTGELGDEELGDLGDAGGGLEDICAIDPEACPEIDMEKEAAKELNPEIYAVQQLYALRVRRFELNPYWAFTFNDQFVSHPAPGLAVNYYITNVLGVGLNGNFYRFLNLDSDFNADVRRAARVGVPLNEYDWSAALNFTYVPAYGKFAGFQDFIFHYDAYLVAGVGAISTRPIPVFDPDFRNFEYKPKLAFNAGIGLRIFFNRWFAGMLEVRDYIYNEELENLSVPTSDQERRNEDSWIDETRITNNVQAQVGVSIFLPFSFEYRLPK